MPPASQVVPSSDHVIDTQDIIEHSDSEPTPIDEDEDEVDDKLLQELVRKVEKKKQKRSKSIKQPYAIPPKKSPALKRSQSDPEHISISNSDTPAKKKILTIPKCEPMEEEGNESDSDMKDEYQRQIISKPVGTRLDMSNQSNKFLYKKFSLGDDQEFEIANMRVKKSKYVPKSFDFDAMVFKKTQKIGHGPPKQYCISVRYLVPLYRCLRWLIEQQKIDSAANNSITID